jgi:hypothetical protein
VPAWALPGDHRPSRLAKNDVRGNKGRNVATRHKTICNSRTRTILLVLRNAISSAHTAGLWGDQSQMVTRWGASSPWKRAPRTHSPGNQDQQDSHTRLSQQAPSTVHEDVARNCQVQFLKTKCTTEVTPNRIPSRAPDSGARSKPVSPLPTSREIERTRKLRSLLLPPRNACNMAVRFKPPAASLPATVIS